MATGVFMTADAVDAAIDPLVASAAFDVSGHLILTTRDATEIDAGAPTLSTPDASTTVKGIVELATTAETEAGSDATRAITPSGLVAAFDTILAAAERDASTTVQGFVELATDAETITGTDSTRATTPASVKAATDAIVADSVTPRPLGTLARRRRTTNSANATTSAGVEVITLGAAVLSGRKIMVCSNGLHMTGGAGDEVSARVYYTTTGTDPTTSDAVLCDLPCTIANAGRYQIMTVHQPYYPGSNHTFKASLFVARKAGTAGNAAIHAVDDDIDFWIEDCGVPAADAGAGADG